MDLLVLLIPALSMIGGFAYAKLWFWVGCWTTILIVVLLWELLAVKFGKEHKTISNQFRTLRKSNPIMAWVLFTFMMVFWWGLILHLGT